MSEKSEYGFIDNPRNGLGIVRARTLLGNLRLWEIPRDQKALDQVVDEIGNDPIPGLYLLFYEPPKKRVYIGQTENLRRRLSSHVKEPDEKIKEWTQAFLINDGRNAQQSDLNDENIRLVLENYLVDLFKINRYTVETKTSRVPSLSGTQKIICDSLRGEINILLTRKAKIQKLLRLARDDERSLEETKRVLERKGYIVNRWTSHEAYINDSLVIIRPGSQKPKGWQVTFRGSTSLQSLKAGKGYLLMPRGNLPLIPLSVIKTFVSQIDSDSFNRDTIDIFVRFEEQQTVLVFKNQELDVSNYVVIQDR